MTEIELAYAAGLFDGEGTVCTHLVSERHMPRLRVAIQMVDAGVIQWFADRFQGHMTIARRVSPTCKRTQFSWHSGAVQAEGFLKALLPYLKAKRPQAERALALRALAKRGRRYGVPEAILREGHRLRLEISNLNRTGTV